MTTPPPGPDPQANQPYGAQPPYGGPPPAGNPYGPPTGGYAVPGGRLVDALFVRAQVERIFAHRRATLASLFEKAP